MKINNVKIVTHAYCPEVASVAGLTAAAIFHIILYWVDTNSKKGTNYHDGRYWTFMSHSKIANDYPYWTRRQVEIGLKKLRAAGLITVDNHSDRACDRTSWYTISDAGYDLIGCGVPTYATVTTTPHNGDVDSTDTKNPHHKNEKSTIKYTKYKYSNTDTNNQFKDFIIDV